MDHTSLVRETEFQRAALLSQETDFTIGNGYVATRGTFEEGLIGDLPATLIHGVFDNAPWSWRSSRTPPTGWPWPYSSGMSACNYRP